MGASAQNVTGAHSLAQFLLSFPKVVGGEKSFSLAQITRVWIETRCLQKGSPQREKVFGCRVLEIADKQLIHGDAGAGNRHFEGCRAVPGL